MPAKRSSVAEIDYAKYDFRNPEDKGFRLGKGGKGLTREVVEEISALKNEPKWMLDFRLRALETFYKKKMPEWGGNLAEIEFDEITYYMKPAARESADDWNEVPKEIKETFEKLGIPEAERKFLAGVGAQYESEMVYHSIRKDLEAKGVVFLSMDEGLKQYPELVKEHFGKVVPIEDNKFAALNSAVWSGGSFVFIPKNVNVDIPLQAYFRINAEKMGQFERTLIIADEGSRVTYVEGCFITGTPIETESGTKKIEDIKEGDRAITHDSSAKTVYHTQVRPYTGKIHEINYLGESRTTLNVTSGHPFLCVPRQKSEYKNTAWEPEWIEAGRLRKGDYLAIPIDRETKSEEYREFSVKMGHRWRGFREEKIVLKTDADFFRLIGYYLAEGTTTGEHYVSFTFNENEKEWIADVKALLKKFFGKEAWEQKPYKHGISLVLSSTIAARFFNNEFGNHSYSKHLPEWAMKESAEKQAELLKAYWRGDGSYMYQMYSWGTKRMFRINTVSGVLARQARNLLLRQGIFASINRQPRKEKRTMFTIYVGGSFLAKFAELAGTRIANEVLLENQKALIETSVSKAVSLAHVTENYAFVPITSIRERHEKNIPVYNFSVEENESYVAGSVAVHNCTAPRYSSKSLHSAVVEIIAKKDSHVRYTTIQNWANNIYNLVTKRAFAYENATVCWVDGNLGSRLTMKYPSVYLLGENAKAEILSVAMASKGQHQDAGAKAVHLAKNTTSTITSKSISMHGGRASYRGLLKVARGATGVKSSVRCDALILDEESRSDTYPSIEIDEQDAAISHEASVGKIGEEQMFYLRSRGIPEDEAMTMIIMGFIRPFTRELPMEYAVELNRLIQLEMEGSVG